MRPINRITPLGNPLAYKTFAITQPLATHWRPGTCAEVECGPHQHGWATAVDERTELGQRQAYHIRKRSDRRFTEEHRDTGLTWFLFEAGQVCFAADKHRVPLERPVNHFTWGGDWRVNPSRHDVKPMRGQDWVESFQDHQDRLRSALERG